MVLENLPHGVGDQATGEDAHSEVGEGDLELLVRGKDNGADLVEVGMLRVDDVRVGSPRLL